MILSRVDRWAIALALIMAAVLLVVAGLVPATRPAQWRDPAKERPRDEEKVVGVYAVYPPARLVRRDVVYVYRLGETGEETYWLEAGEWDEAKLDLGKPYRWATTEDAARLDLPEIPDLYLEAIARREMK
jgi:uncharacterized protein YjeT (DUF2065 family)